MSNIQNSKRIVNNKLLLIMVIIAIVVSDDTLLFGTNLDNRFISAKYIIIIATFCLLFIRVFAERIKINANVFLIAITMMSLLIISCVLNNDFRLGYFYRCILVMSGLLFTTVISFDDFTLHYDKVMKSLAIASLIGFALFRSFAIVLDLFPTVLNSAHMEFYNLFFTVIPKYSGGFARNYGIFREPGVFQMFLIIGLMFQMFALKRPRTKVQIVYIIALVTTFSTTGYIALIFVAILYFTKKNDSHGEKTSKVIIIVCLLLILIYLLFFTGFIYKEGYGSVFGKLTDSTNASLSARLASVVVNLKLFFNSPVWGVGVTHVDTSFAPLAQSILGVYTIHNTNTVFWQLAAYGAIFTFLWLCGIYKLCRRLSVKKIDTMVIFIIFMILFFGENLSYSLITSVLLFYGLNGSNTKKLNISES